MSETDQIPSGKPDESSGSVAGKDFVKHESYVKAVNAEKAAKERERKLAEELAAIKAEREREQQAKLEAEGKFKEAAEEYKRKFEEAEKKTMTFAKTYGQKVFTAETRTVALELGANPEAVDDLIKTGDWSDVEIGQDFAVDRDKLKSALVKMQQQKPWYFKSQVAAPRDVAPGMKVQGGPKPLNEMSVDELVEFAKKNYK